MNLNKLAKDHIKNLKPCIHGGEVWNYNKYEKKVLDYSANVNPLSLPQKVINTIKENFWKIPFYPESNYYSLKSAISNYIGTINHKNLILGNGSTEIIYLFADTFIKPDEKTLIVSPTFGEYEAAVLKAGGRPIHLPLLNDFKINVKELIQKIPEVKAIFLCNPNNPTSLLIGLDELKEILGVALSEEVLVFIDEDFMEFVPRAKQSSQISEINVYPNLFILKSFTKFFGLTGLRIGYGIGNDQMIEVLSKSLMPWNINCLADVAAIVTLNDSEFIEDTYKLIDKERAYLLRELSKIKGFRIIPPDANFFLINIERTGFNSKELKNALLKYGILIRDCSSFKGLDEYFIRIAIRTRKENEYLLEAFKKVCS